MVRCTLIGLDLLILTNTRFASLGGVLPPAFADLVRDRGCVILRNVVSEEEASGWEASLKDYVKRHPGVGGFPKARPAGWNVFWTKAQVEARSHPRVMEAMKSVSKLWHVNDPKVPVDLDSQVVYPDRIRIRYPSNDPSQFPLAPQRDGRMRLTEPITRQSLTETGRTGMVGLLMRESTLKATYTIPASPALHGGVSKGRFPCPILAPARAHFVYFLA